MPNPKTIEELLEMKPCPFRDFEWITPDKFRSYIKKGLISSEILYSHIPHSNLTISGNEKFSFKMPRGYYHLPPDKQLGLPLGEWYFSDLIPLICSLPFSVICMYCNDSEIAVDENGNYLVLESFTTRYRTFNIKKQPCNLYNPLDHKEEISVELANTAKSYVPTEAELEAEADWFMNAIMVTKEEFIKKPVGHFCSVSENGIYFLFNEAHSKKDMQDVLDAGYPIYSQKPDTKRILWHREQLKEKQAQQAKETVIMETNSANEQPTPTELPWQDISTLKDSTHEGWIMCFDATGVLDCENYITKDIVLREFNHCYTHWFPITPPKAPKIEAPVEPERVSVQEFAKDPVGKWYSFNGTYYYEATVVEPVAKYKRFEDVLRTGYPIYATDPSAWLAWKAEQEGKSG